MEHFPHGKSNVERCGDVMVLYDNFRQKVSHITTKIEDQKGMLECLQTEDRCKFCGKGRILQGVQIRDVLATRAGRYTVQQW